MFSKNNRTRLIISGLVENSSIKPSLYRLAQELRLTGWARMEDDKAIIEVQGETHSIETFTTRLQALLSTRTTSVVKSKLPLNMKEKGMFKLLEGHGRLQHATPADTGICDECKRELHDPSNRRFGDPFIMCNCCGPRYTITTAAPVERSTSTMSGFAMCRRCRTEYEDTSNRRYHMEHISCPRCGPVARLIDSSGQHISTTDAVKESARLLASGRIIAIKGIGGYYLACRADDDYAVRRLRRRKKRDFKPFTVMVKDAASAKSICRVDASAAEALQSPARPVVIMPTSAAIPRLPMFGTSADGKSLYSHIVLSKPARRCVRLAAPVAEGLDAVGVMLPATGLEVLIFDKLDEIRKPQIRDPWPPPLVMIPANYTDEPVVKDDESACALLGGIADAILTHDRPIERRLEHTVLRSCDDGDIRTVERGLGTTPTPVELDCLDPDGPTVLAVGGEIDNAICLLRGNTALLGEHIGDMRDGRTYRHFINTIRHFEDLFDAAPQVIAADCEPWFLSSEYALRRWRGQIVARASAPLVRVHHHHAHAVSCLSENGITTPAVAIVCDGGGRGADDTEWGCEILRVHDNGFDRLGHLISTPLPGGNTTCTREIWRSALGILHETFGAPCIDHLRARPLKVPAFVLIRAMEMIELDTHCTPSGALGRWFDAASWLTGLARANTYPGEAAMKLESAITPGIRDVYMSTISTDGPFVMDPRAMMEGIISDLTSAKEIGVIAAKFHNTIAKLVGDAAIRAAEASSVDTVALSGGCFSNRYLTRKLTDELTSAGLRVVRHRNVPTGAGGLALGQAIIAARKFRNR